VTKDLFNLPPPERLKRYREIATEAEALAGRVISSRLRDGYLTIARRWRELAEQLEKSMRGSEAEKRDNREMTDGDSN
jgi:hypothetical protein